MSNVQEFHDNPPSEPPVRGYLHLPASPSGEALVLTHGAGANANAPLLVALATAFSDSGWTVLRCDLPFRQARPTGPPPPGSADRDQQGLKAALGSRTTHFPRLQTPALFVHGVRDPFGSIEELTEALKLIPARTELLPIAAAGHELLTRQNRDDLPTRIVDAFRSFTYNSEV
jgi:predicted alpha/beta-hydrolase family hydrolase